MATDDLPARERARIEHRDGKRRTKMVIDNRGMFRVQQALAERARLYREETKRTGLIGGPWRD